MERIRLKAPDGFSLAATRFSPVGVPKAVIVLPDAMGVKQDYYFPFAGFLRDQGFAVLTFDYRGIGWSVPESFKHSLRGFEADIFDWAEQDYNAALHVASAWREDAPLLVIGHSLGGQLVGLLPDNHLIDGILTVACGSGYWRHTAPRTKRLAWLLWYFAVPLYTRVFGYFPGKRMRKVGDLPKGVINQWSQWCRSPHYVVDEKGAPLRAGFDRIRAPVLSLSFSDDEMMSRRGIEILNECFRNAPIEQRSFKPGEVGARHIGHFGFFRTQFQATLWREALDWLNRRAIAGKQGQSHCPAV